MIKLPHNISVNNTLYEIGEFVRHCLAQDDFAGINVLISKTPGKSYVIGKVFSTPKPKWVLPIFLDYSNPVQRPIIADAIHRAMYGEGMTPEAMENEMVSKADEN